MPKQNCNYIEFANIVGFDDDSLWVTCDRDGHSAIFLQLLNGHWEYRQAVGHSPEWQVGQSLVQRPHLLSPSTFVPCVQSSLYEVTASAVKKIPTTPDSTEGWHRSGPSGVAVITEDYYFHMRGEYRDAYIVSQGKATLLDDGTKKEAFVYSTEFNAPLEEYRVTQIGFPATFQRGSCIGFCAADRMAKIVEFRDGKWWDKCDMTLTRTRQSAVIEPDDVRDVYFGTHDGRVPGFAVACGPYGRVIYKDFNGVEEERSVIPRQESTTAELIRVWGVSAEKYWVMDAKGEVWERSNGQTRVVVRGLHDSEQMDSDRGFCTAWVSITGNVFAATEKHLFKLS